MRWEDEPYVKLYSRDTPTWKAMCWQAKALWPLLMRKLDKAGLLECGQLGRGAVGLMVELPEEVVTQGLGSLEQLGVIFWHGNTLEAPKFEEAQEAIKSDLVRKREQRKRAREEARTQATENAEVSRDVTNGHEKIPSVTPVTRCHEMSLPTQPNPDIPTQKEKTLSENPTEVSSASPGQEVFEHWRRVMGKTEGAKFKGKRKQRVVDRLKDGYSVDDLKAAVDGCAVTPHNIGQNPSGQRFDDLELICRDVERVERFMANARAPPKPPEKPRDVTKGSTRAEDFNGLHDKGFDF